MAKKKLISVEESHQISDAEVFMTLVIPAYNEQHRLNGMLEEAVEYLEEQYGHHGTASKSSSNGTLQASGRQGDPHRGWEIILVSDGSTDKTVNVALNFARTHQLNKPPPKYKGPWGDAAKGTNILPGTIRVVQLEENRGKGGAVTHGMRHARGSYVIFADADGASKFSCLGDLVVACEKAKDALGRAVGVGSRAHMVGTDAVVKVRLAPNLISISVLIELLALRPPQPAHARLPPRNLAPHHPQNLTHQRHTMRLQALLTPIPSLHHPVHALRRLDLRRRNVDARRKRRYTHGRSADWLERSCWEQVECYQG